MDEFWRSHEHEPRLPEDAGLPGLASSLRIG
jgi:hypothetical protein